MSKLNLADDAIFVVLACGFGLLALEDDISDDERAILETAARTAERINKRRVNAALPIETQLAVQPVIPNGGC